jgi:hypothetical protein
VGDGLGRAGRHGITRQANRASGPTPPPPAPTAPEIPGQEQGADDVDPQPDSPEDHPQVELPGPAQREPIHAQRQGVQRQEHQDQRTPDDPRAEGAIAAGQPAGEGDNLNRGPSPEQSKHQSVGAGRPRRGEYRIEGALRGAGTDGPGQGDDGEQQERVRRPHPGFVAPDLRALARHPIGAGVADRGYVGVRAFLRRRRRHG